MQKVIIEKLKEIESRENVKILYCVESGSRAWDFASPDSDYDVRFVYVRPKDYYLRLDKTNDVIEWQLDDTLDINGWDISKFLQLLYKSNPTTFEWKSSPIVYKTTSEWDKVSKIEDLTKYSAKELVSLLQSICIWERVSDGLFHVFWRRGWIVKILEILRTKDYEFTP